MAIDEIGTEKDYPSGSVNIQTDAISFEQNKLAEQRSSTTGKDTQYKKQKTKNS